MGVAGALLAVLLAVLLAGAAAVPVLQNSQPAPGMGQFGPPREPPATAGTGTEAPGCWWGGGVVSWDELQCTR